MPTLQEHVRDIRSVLEGELRAELAECVGHVHEGIDQNFRNGGNVEGAWPPHAPSTVARYGVHPLLILSGDLHEAATNDAARGAVTDLQDREANLSIDLGAIPYARRQNLGDPGGYPIPQREFHVVGEETVDKCEESVAGGIAERLGL